MSARKAQEPIAVSTLGQVEVRRPLSVRRGLGGDMEAKGRGEGTNDVEEWVHVIDWIVESRPDLARIIRLAEVDLDVADFVVLEEG